MEQQPYRYIDIREVSSLTGLAKTPIYDRIKCREFPSPIPLSRNCVRWRSDEVFAWMEKQSSNRDAGRKERSEKARAAVAKRKQGE